MLKRLLLCLAAASFIAVPAFGAGVLVTKTVQDGSGTHTQYFVDMSGTGVGPFQPTVACVDASANIGCGGSGGGGGSVTQGTTPWVDKLAAGGGMDAAGANVAFPGNEFIIGGLYNSSPPTLTTGNVSPLLLDANGNLFIASPSLLAAIAAPPTPCTNATCSGENPIGPVLINGTLPAFAATPTFNLGTIGAAATAANQVLPYAQGSTTAAQTGPLLQAATLQAAPTYVTADTNPLVLDPGGNLQVGNGSAASSVTPTVTASAYTSGQELGGLITFTKTANYGTLYSLTVTTHSVQAATIDAYVFYTNPNSTTWTDKSTPAINALDASKIIWAATLSAPKSGLGTHTEWHATGISVNLTSATYYVILIVNGAFTPVSTTDVAVRTTVRY